MSAQVLDHASAPTDVAICPACGQHNPNAARFCMHCGTRMVVEEGERRIVTVVFVELNGFLSFAERASAEDVRALADRATSRLIATVVSFEGTLDKIIGENGLKLMAIFGAPVAHGDDPERAVRAALAMHASVEADPEAFSGCRLAIGINTGDAIYAPVGPGGEHTVLGDMVNTAARLMSAAAAGETLVGAVTARHVAQAIDLEEIAPLTVKNKTQPVAAWRAQAIKGQRTERARVRAPLVGRDRELSALREHWERMPAKGRPHLVSVIGPPGVGKTRLVETFASQIGAVVSRGRCLSFGEGITYWPIVEIIKELAGATHGDEPDALSRKLGTLLEGLGVDDPDELRTMAVAIANVVAAPTTPRGTYTADKISKRELHWGIRRLLQRLSARVPHVLLVEDLHWAEPTLLDLLTYLLEEDGQFFLVATARPEFADGVPPLLEASHDRARIDLEPLGEDASVALLTALLGERAEHPRPLLEAAAGNPLFLEELVQMLIDTGMIGRDGTSTRTLASVPVPDSLHALIDARLDRLAARERRIAGRCAVVGHVFWTGAVQALDPDADVERALETLIDKDIIVRVDESSIAGEKEFSFKHAMLRDVAYDRIPKSERALLHERCGRWIAQLPGSENEYIEFVAYHLEQAVRVSKQVVGAAEPSTLAAVQALQRAGVKAEGHEGTTEADRFYERALDLVGDRYPETQIELRSRRARTMIALGKQIDAEAEWRALVDGSVGAGRDDLRCMALLTLANMLGRGGRLDEADQMIDEALGLARRMRHREAEIQLTMLSGNLRLNRRGDPAGLDLLLSALDEAEDAGFREMTAFGLAQVGTSYLNLGRPSDAEEPFVRCADVGKELASVQWSTVAESSLAFVRFLLGPWDEAEASAMRALELLKRNPQFTPEFQTLRLLGRMALMRGDLADAERFLAASREVTRRGAGWWLVGAERQMAEVAALSGDAAGAARAAEVAEASVIGDNASVVAVCRIAEAFAAMASDDLGRFKRRFEDALELLAQPAFAFDHAEETLSYARALHSVGDPAAESWFARARDAYVHMNARAIIDWIDANAPRPPGGGRGDASA